MSDDRRTRIITRLFPQGRTDLGSAATVRGVRRDHGHDRCRHHAHGGSDAAGSACTSNDVSAQIEELQFTLGEGPCVEKHCTEDGPILEPDLADPVSARWLGFTGPADHAGVRAVFGFPLRIGTLRFGTLDLLYAISRARSAANSMPTRWSWPMSPRRRCCSSRPTAARRAGRGAGHPGESSVRRPSGGRHDVGPARDQRCSSAHSPPGLCLCQRPAVGGRGRRDRPQAPALRWPGRPHVATVTVEPESSSATPRTVLYG